MSDRNTRALAAAAAFLSILAGSQAVVQAADEVSPTDPVAGIRGRQVAARVRFLASEFLEGREAGSRGERLAAEYIRDFYLGLGLSPAGEEGSFYQSFDLHEKTLGEENELAVVRLAPGGAELRTRYALDHDFLPFNFSPSARIEAPVVFAGYGISAPEHGYDDYAGLDVRGAIVLVLRHEPRETDPASPFKGLRSTKHAAFLSKVRLAQRKGAVGLLLVTDPLGHEPDAREPGNQLARWNTLVERGEFDKRPQPDAYQFYPEIAPDVSIPALHVAPDVAGALIAGLDLDLEALQRGIDAKLKPASRKLPGVRAAISTDVTLNRVPVRNVIARLEGADPALKDEVVIIGGHYDHLGYGHFGSASGAWGQIHPGADDNASGTACILSIAEALSRAPRPPLRSIVFMHFTAEEKGLMGSRWFVEHPTVPLSRTLAMFNLDMVGRNDPNVVSLVGDPKAAGLDTLLKRLGRKQLSLTLNNDAGSGIDRSDQWSFALKGVPALALFSGVHDDYHRPSDTASEIVADKLENVSKLVAIAAWELAERGRAAIEDGDGRKGEVE